MRQEALNPRSDPASPWWHIDVTPLLATLGLTIIGLIGIYSATRGLDSSNYVTFFIERQGMFVVTGLGLIALIVMFDYRYLLRLAGVIYAVATGALVLVLLVGVEANGARSWFSFGAFLLQPSEFAKVALVVILAAMMSRRVQGQMPLEELMVLLALASCPILLIVGQPDVGTAMVYAAITAAMLLVGRAEAHHLLFLVATTAVLFGLLMNAPFLPDYQRVRLETFLDVTSDERYTQNQAEIAIGNGGLAGLGFGKGTQTSAGLVPEQQFDFIFTVIAEEFGFIGGVVLLGCYGFLLWRLYRMARLAGDNFGGYLIVGFMTIFAFQMFQSVGMTMGIMPITGIPLPFVSYGGSSALTSYICIGVVLNVHMRRFGASIDAEVGQKR